MIYRDILWHKLLKLHSLSLNPRQITKQVHLILIDRISQKTIIDLKYGDSDVGDIEATKNLWWIEDGGDRNFDNGDHFEKLVADAHVER